MDRNIFFMKLAIKQAMMAYDRLEVPIGAVIVDSQKNEVVASGFNMVESDKNPVAHAEMKVINEACAKLGSKYLTGFDIYVTLEPCPMCATAISLAKIDRVFFAASNDKSRATQTGLTLYSEKKLNHIPEVFGSILEEESSQLLKKFFQEHCRK